LENPEQLRGQRVGPYRIHKLLGAGGSGAVYQATNLNVGLEACVKLSYPLQSDPASIMEAVSRGIRGVVTLKHPNVVQVYDFERLELSDGTSFYIVMELIDGVHLGKWTRQISDDQFAFQRRLKMAEQITTAFDAAHNCSYFDKAGFQLRGVLHGDIKPTNIHVRKNNEPAIMDFMLVDVQRLLHGGESTARPAIGQTDMLTAVFGTPGYMAPEQENTGIVTVQSDVYALGMTFFDLFFPVGEPVSASTVSSQQAMHICKTLTSAETRSPARYRPASPAIRRRPPRPRATAR
jgi:serine/threonine-protein kinase